MRRLGRKHGIRSNRRIRSCTSCKFSHASRINDALTKAIFKEVQAEKPQDKNDRAKERKRSLRKVADVEPEYEFNVAKKTKREQYKEAWKKINKGLIMKVCRNEGASIVGDPCHRCVMADRERYHNLDYYLWGTKGMYKHSKGLSRAYKGRGVEEAIDSIEKLPVIC